MCSRWRATRSAGGAFGHPEWGAFTLGKTNPHFSTSGLNATVGTYFAVYGLSTDLSSKDRPYNKLVPIASVSSQPDQCGRAAHRRQERVPSDTDLDAVINQPSGSSESTATAVRVFPIAYGEKADLGVLTKIGEASRAAAYDATDPASIDKVLTAVISNF